MNDGSEETLKKHNSVTYYDNGDSFNGILVNDKKEGFGVQRIASRKTVYEGNFLNDEKEGFGKLINENGHTYSGISSYI